MARTPGRSLIVCERHSGTWWTTSEGVRRAWEIGTAEVRVERLCYFWP